MRTSQTRRRGAALLLGATAPLLLACAHEQHIVRPPSELRVYNESAVEIASIQQKPCASSEEAFRPMLQETIAPGQSVGIPLVEGCVDLMALSSAGEVAGRQSQLFMIPGATWTIR
jgi:hypothetical protein